ncbi:hypothetical protein GCM10020000_20420 [Streptomyces olivoverticillatus]
MTSSPIPLVRPDVLADDRADEREAEADVQAGEDPGGGRRDDDLQRHPAVARAQDAGVGHEVAVHLARPLEGVEEDGEEDQHHGRGDLGNRPEAEQDEEDRRQHDPRQRVEDLDERAEHIGEETDPAEDDAQQHTARHPDDPAEQGLVERVSDLFAQRAVSGAVGRPLDELVPDLRRHREVERVDGLVPGEHLPGDQHGDKEQRPGSQDHQLAPSGSARPGLGAPLGALACDDGGGDGLRRHGRHLAHG